MMDFPVLDDMAEDAYQMQHWRMNLRVAGEGMGDIEDVLEGWVRVALSEGSQKASFLRIVRERWARIEEGAGQSSPGWRVGERAGVSGHFESWSYARLIESQSAQVYGRGWRGAVGREMP